MNGDQRQVIEIKYILSILGYALIVYPLKRFVFPFYHWMLENIYLFMATLIGYILLYLYDFDIQKIITELTNKTIENDMPFWTWVFNPILSLGGFDISPVEIILYGIIVMACARLLLLIRGVFRQVKQVFGDFLIVVMWVYYTLSGNAENSVLLITRDEVKAKLQMYVVIFIVLALAILYVIGQNALFNPVDIPDQIVIANTTFNKPPGI